MDYERLKCCDKAPDQKENVKLQRYDKSQPGSSRVRLADRVSISQFPSHDSHRYLTVPFNIENLVFMVYGLSDPLET